MSERESSTVATWIGYVAMLATTVALYFALDHAGARVVAAAPGPLAPRFGAAATAHTVDALVHVLLALATVIVVARALGALFKRLEQPPVVGEILAGILLGPSLLGRVAPDLAAFVLPPSVAPHLGVLAEVGVILYMFLVGVELDPAVLRKRGHATLVISHASIAAPFVLGVALALVLYPRLATSDVPFGVFALFIGVSMSVTAFPVLARILTDRRIHTSPLGVLALTCAALQDATAWCLLAFVVAVAQARAASALTTAALAAAYVAVMVFVARPAMVWLARAHGRRGRLTQGVMAIVFVALLASSLATDVVGIHAVFGAFALGVVVPHDSTLARDLTDRLEDLVVVLLLPAFFAFTGLRTRIGLVSGAGEWALCGLVIAVASVGKFGGSFVAARATGLATRDAAALGVLMNTRGLMELIVLNIGLDLHVVSPTLFAMLVVMAVVTTVATTPLLHALGRGTASVDAPRPAATTSGGVLAPIANPVTARPIVELALAATGKDEPPPRVVAFVDRPAGLLAGLHATDAGERPSSPVLVEAAAYARSLGGDVATEALWSDDAASDILDLARASGCAWLLVGFHRPIFGDDFLGGMVRTVLSRARGTPLHVGVVVHGQVRPFDKLVALVDDSDDGRAALDLAARVAQGRGAALHALVVPRVGDEPEPPLRALLEEAARTAGRWLRTDVLGEQDRARLVEKAQAPLVIMGATLADALGLPLDEVPGASRCVVLVQGGRPAASSTERAVA